MTDVDPPPEDGPDVPDPAGSTPDPAPAARRRGATGAGTGRAATPGAASRRLAGRRAAPPVPGSPAPGSPARGARPGPAGAPSGRAQRPRPGPDPSPAGPEPVGGGKATTTFRGVRWERNTAGRLRWRDDDQHRWVLWRPGQDAPPRPPGWVVDEPIGTPLRDKRARAGWRSPYRLVPIGLVVLVLVVGIVQATSHKTSAGTEADQAATKLLDHCLATDGTANGQPIYEAGSVPCSSSHASVKVVAVLPRAATSSTCPKATSSVRLAFPGVSSPPVLCVTPVRS
jgi:hypothetical protein